MRTVDLLGAPVSDSDGTRRGVVIEIRTRAERNARGEVVLVLHGFVVGMRRWQLLGYERQRERGPALLSALMRLAHRSTRYAPYDDVDMSDEDGLRLLRPWDDLPALHEIPE